jgi:hypothetical protein
MRHDLQYRAANQARFTTAHHTPCVLRARNKGHKSHKRGHCLMIPLVTRRSFLIRQQAFGEFTPNLVSSWRPVADI